MSKSSKFITALIVETLAIVAIFYALGVARNNSLSARDADHQPTKTSIREAHASHPLNPPVTLRMRE